VAAYRIVGVREPVDVPRPDVLTFTSSAGVRATYERLAADGLEGWMQDVPIVCIGPVTAETVRDMGLEVAAMASEYTIPGMVAAVVQWASEREGAHA